MIGAGLERHQAMFVHGDGGEHGDRGRRGAGLALEPANLPRRRQPVQPRHLHVHQHEIESPRAERLDRLLAVAGHGQADAQWAQEQLDHALIGRMVFGHQNAKLAQRLARTICEFCGHQGHYSDAELVASGLIPEEWRGFKFREGAGCMECGGTGFKGRSAIHELLELDDEIREMLLAKKPGSEIRKKAKEKGMGFLRDSAIERVREGVTTLKEINKVTFIEAGR